MVEGKIKFPLWIAPETKEIVAESFRQDNCKSMSEFIEKAILFYNGYLHARHAEYYLPRVLGSVLQGTLGLFGDRIGKLLFKLAVEMAIMMNVLAAFCDVEEGSLANLRQECINEVKRINGTLGFEDAYHWQND